MQGAFTYEHCHSQAPSYPTNGRVGKVCISLQIAFIWKYHCIGKSKPSCETLEARDCEQIGRTVVEIVLSESRYLICSLRLVRCPAFSTMNSNKSLFPERTEISGRNGHDFYGITRVRSK